MAKTLRSKKKSRRTRRRSYRGGFWAPAPSKAMTPAPAPPKAMAPAPAPAPSKVPAPAPVPQKQIEIAKVAPIQRNFKL